MGLLDPASGRAEEIGVLVLASTPVVSVAQEASVGDAINIMAEKGFRRLPVVDSEGKLKGIVTATDLLSFLIASPKHELMVEKYGQDLAAALSEPISTVAAKEVFSVRRDSTLAEALELMAEKRVGGLPVVDEEGRLWAIITERDVAKGLAGRLTGVRVSELMTPEPITIRPEASVREAVETMMEHGFRRLPVVGPDGRLQGIITSMDVIRLLARAREEGRLGPALLETRVSDVCVREVITVGPDDDIGRAAELMWEHRVGGLPVVEPGTGKLVGIITERDFFKLLRR